MTYRTNALTLIKTLEQAPKASFWKKLFHLWKARKVHSNLDAFGKSYNRLFCSCLVCWKERGFRKALFGRDINV